MEREPVIPNPGELTGQGQNTYSNNMPDGNGAEFNPQDPGSQDDTSELNSEQLERVEASQDTSDQVRQAARELLASDREAAVQRRMLELAQEMRRGGEEPDSDSMRVIRLIAESQEDAARRGTGTRAERSRFSRDERSEDDIPPAFDLGPEIPETPRADMPEPEADERSRTDGPRVTDPRILRGTKDSVINKESREWDAAIAATMKSGEYDKNKVIGWLVDPKAREDHFNSIYALVDARPYDFWNDAFDQLNDGAKEHLFNNAILNASRGRFEEIDTGRYSNQKISKDDIERVLAERNKTLPEGEKMTILELQRELDTDFKRFTRERQVRKTLHDVNAVLYIPGVKAEDLFGMMQRFDSASGDLALSIPGVRDMMGIYENVLREIMAENNGFLPSELVLGKSETIMEKGRSRLIYETAEAETRTKERFKKLLEAGLIKTRSKKQDIKTGEWESVMADIPEYERDRIFTLARGMMLMEERLISIASESKLPTNEVRFASAFMQDIIQSTSAYAHMLSKWGITDEALGAYLFKGEHNEGFSRIFQGWSPNELKHAYNIYKKDPEILFESLDTTFYLGRRNPNRAGDIYTWIGWRGVPKPDVPSMLQDYLLAGQERMANRWNDKALGKGVRAEEYINFINNPKYKMNRMSTEQALTGGAKGMDVRSESEKNLVKQMREDWQKLHRDAPSIEDFQKYWNEYESWTGTGFRFEKLRNDLDLWKAHDKHSHDKYHDAFEKVAGHGGHGGLFEKMVDLQPHRIYTISRWVRERVNAGLSAEQRQNISRDLGNLSMVESAWINDREKLLDEGKTFSKLSYKDFEEYADKVLTDPAERESAKNLARKIREDFANERIKDPKENNYWKEFIYKREYTHGFVLWSGDTPADEYSFSKLGATGGFVRRARDNDNQAKAAAAEAGLLDNLKNITEPDDLIAGMMEIWKNIDHYDRSKAQQAMAEKAEGFVKFYKAHWMNKLPVVGLVGWKKDSYARQMYGYHAPAWESSTIRYFLDQLHHKHLIKDEDHHRLMMYLGAENKQLAAEMGSNASVAIILAYLLESFKTLAKEIPAAASE